MRSGRLTGSGLLQNPVTVYVPHNDFIFAVIGAEFGFLGSVAVIGVMFAVIIKCLIIAHNSPIYYGKIIAACVAVMFAFQAFLNVSVVSGAMPNTGMTFPFISAGGSSMWINLACVGLVINIGMTKERRIFEN
jgi:cell division protein FtsW (lipid II flippase)